MPAGGVEHFGPGLLIHQVTGRGGRSYCMLVNEPEEVGMPEHVPGFADSAGAAGDVVKHEHGAHRADYRNPGDNHRGDNAGIKAVFGRCPGDKSAYQIANSTEPCPHAGHEEPRVIQPERVGRPCGKPSHAQH